LRVNSLFDFRIRNLVGMLATLVKTLKAIEMPTSGAASAAARYSRRRGGIEGVPRRCGYRETVLQLVCEG